MRKDVFLFFFIKNMLRVRRMCYNVSVPRKNRLVVQEMTVTLLRNTENNSSTNAIFPGYPSRFTKRRLSHSIEEEYGHFR